MLTDYHKEAFKEEQVVGRERKGQTGDRTRDYPIHAGRSATELPSPLLEESSTPTQVALQTGSNATCEVKEPDSQQKGELRRP